MKLTNKEKRIIETWGIISWNGFTNQVNQSIEDEKKIISEHKDILRLLRKVKRVLEK